MMQASPFAAALYSGQNTLLLLVIGHCLHSIYSLTYRLTSVPALNQPASEQFMAAKEALRHIKQHVQTSIPMVFSYLHEHELSALKGSFRPWLGSSPMEFRGRLSCMMHGSLHRLTSCLMLNVTPGAR